MVCTVRYIRTLFILLALLFGVSGSVWADLTKSEIVIDGGTPDGEVPDKYTITNGSVTIKSVVDATRLVTITVTPAAGYCINKSDIVVQKLADPSRANARQRVPGIAELLAVAGPPKSKVETDYTFVVPADYAGALVTVTFTELPPATATVIPKSLVYTGEPQDLVTLGAVVGGADTNPVTYSLIEDGTYTTTIPTGINADNYTVYYKVAPDGAHSEGKGSVSVTIQKATLTEVTLTHSVLTHTGDPITFEISSVKAGSITVPAGSYEVDDVSGNALTQTSIGTYTLKVKAKDGDANFSGTTSTTFRIVGGSVVIIDSSTNAGDITDPSKTYILASDISASQLANLYNSAFTGELDGNGYTISSLEHALFNTVNGGVVKNVTLKNVAISSSEEYVGAIACIAQGYSRIYNCGILPNDATFPKGTHPTVTGGTCAGGIVGKLDGDSRVINCYSYADVSASTYAAGIVGQNTYASTAEVSGGKYTKLKTAVVNCMFYGNITGGTNQYGVYGGTLITNAAATGISSYNYYRSGSTFNTNTGEPTAYNCSFPADERYLTQVEFHRSLLNSNRELCGWWVGSDVAPSTLTTTEVQAIPKDASLMYKWVVDPNLAPYPILKPFGKYPSIINTNTGTPWFDRSTANEFEGKQLGTLSVIIKSGASAPDQHLFIPITDMDSLHYDFGYRKIQLPYYNTVFGNPNGATWEKKYAGNYTDQVVTGWKVTNVSGGNEGSFVAHWQDGYNFADRNCTEKDLYSVSGRVFAQGGYYYVPDGVTEITIEAYWGKAIYVRNKDSYYDRVNITIGNTGAAFAPAGVRDNNVNGATIQTTSIKETLTDANIDAKKTVYDYALVLVGNVQESVGQKDVTHATEATRGFTIMSVDLDFDEEPDYCLEWQLGFQTKRQVIAPIRFDFLPVVELGIAGKLHNSKYFLSLGCFRSKGHFEVTETAFIRFGQFEFELKERDEGPVILNGGIYDQYCRGRNDETDQHINYVILGGHIVMPSFTPGAHVSSGAKYQTRHCAVNVLGGDFTSFYLTGGYNEAIVPYEDNPHCYIDGGRFGTIAAAYKEGIWGDVTWRINRALIGEFYGGGVMAQKDGTTYKIVKGSIDVVINNSIVGKYCGGPKFGDMVADKTVTTSASNTVFNQFFGAGNGGTNYMQYKNTDATGVPVSDWSGTINSNYTPGKYLNKDQGYAADYDIEVINPSTGDYTDGRVVNRSYYYSAQFATTNTGNVTSTLNNCTINTNFYGGGFLGGVTGNVTSTLNNCTVNGAVFGAGYSASAGTVDIHNKDKVPPVPNLYTGMIKPQSGGTFTRYEWTNNKTFGSTTLSKESPTIVNPNGDGKNYIYTEVSLQNLGAVSGNVTLTINGKTVGESVYGGGEESTVNGDTEVNVTGGTIGTTGKGGATWGNVYGGGKGKEQDVTAGLVKGNTTVNISSLPDNNKTKVLHNVYGGGAYGSVGTFTYDDSNTITGYTSGGQATVNIVGGTFGTDGHDNGMVFGSSRGKEGNPLTDTNIDKLAWVYNTVVNVGTAGSATGPMVNGSVYGGGENGHNYQNAAVNIHSGTIGYTSYDPTSGYNCGSVFGAGCGTDKYTVGEVQHYNPLAGTVWGNTTIAIDGGHIRHNVYGGGAIGSAGKADGSNGKATITVTGGRVGTDGNDNGNIYGAPRGDSEATDADIAQVVDTEVNINYATTPTGDNTEHTAQLIAGSVFGGGQSGVVRHSVVVNMKGGLVLRDLYGGSALANTNIGNATNYGTSSEAISSTSTYTTTLNLHGGIVGHNVYGGGLGRKAATGVAPVAALVYGDVMVKLNETIATDNCRVKGNVFGCNNYNGTPKGIPTVHVYKTVGYDESHKKSTDKDDTTYDVHAVYGGGNEAAYQPALSTSSTNVIIDGCDLTSIQYVYGGGNAAPAPATQVTVNSCYEIGSLFGGGNGYDDLEDGSPNPGADVGLINGSPYGSGDANTLLYGGKVHEAYGASNFKGTIRGAINLDVHDGGECALQVDKIVGAGKNADIDGDVIVVMGCMPTTKTPLVFGGADNANVNGNVELTITSGTFGKVFGGNNLGGVIKGHIKVNIEETGCNPINIDELYLGGNQAAYSVFGYYDSGETLSNGKVKYLPRTSTADTQTAIPNPATDATHTFPYAQPVMNVTSCTSIGSVFGGGLGSGAVMYADPTVNINMVQGAFANALPVDADNNPNKLGAVENVYGGGNEAAVYGNTTVNIGTLVNQNIVLTSPEGETEENRTKKVLGAFITGTVYGAGKGVETDPAAAIVMGNTQVNMAGGHVSRSIYGGGELGSVGTFTESYTATSGSDADSDYHVKGEPKTCAANTGKTEVIVSGGQVGLVNQLMPDPSRPTSDDDYGYIFCAGKGMADPTDTNSDGVPYANLLAVSGSSHLEISGGLITGSVYGGSENGQVLNDTHVKIAGGQIGTGYDSANNTWDGVYTEEKWTAAIAKVKAGTFTDADAASFHECDAWPFGAEGQRYIYDPYADTDGYNSQGGSKSAGNGHSFYGNVFGGGSGFYPYAPGQWRRSAGRVCGNTHVEITGGHILTNVYGGNEITDVLGKSTVEMKGGTLGVPRSHASIEAHPVNCYIFGGGMGDPRPMFNGWSNVGSSEVIVSDNAVVFGSVFGGGEDGHVLGNAQTTIKGNAHIGTFGDSSVDGNIFGSGRGFSALALTAGVVCGNVIVNIQDQAKLLGSVFGGGRLAAVGTHLAAEDDANYGVLIPEGQDPYGTGSTKHGNVTVNITGGTIGNQALMSTSQYSIGDVFGGSKGAVMEESAKSQKLGLVKNTTVNISQAEGSTTTIYGNVYGGGEIASVGSYTYATDEQAAEFNDDHAPEVMSAGDVYAMRDADTGLAEINITGGTIGQNSLSDTNGSVFGGCLGKSGTEYSGYSFVQNAKVNISQAKGSTTTIYGCVFGGGENGHVYKDTDVKIKGGTIGIPLDDVADADIVPNMIYRGNVYGGGRGVDKTSLGDYSLTAGKVNGNTNVTVEGGTIYRCVYGGGSLASVGKRNEPASDKTNGKATVTIKGGTIGTDGGAASNDYTTLIPTRTAEKENGYVYGSGRGMAAGHEANATVVNMAFTRFTEVNIEDGATVTGSVFGGGENGHVKYDTKVTMSGGTVGTELTEDEHAIDDNGRGRLIYRANVYGGGRGLDTGGDDNYSLTAGRVYGNTYVKVSGGKIYHDVFGGGSLASVGNETVNTTTGEVTYGDNSGNTEVHISGGIIGCSETHPELQGFNCGFVYGGCRGLAAAPSSDIVKMAYVHGAKVYIESGANIKGSVFGGGANGHVKNNTYVEISGGSIGTALTKDEVGFDDHGVAKKPVFRGNVYAGGRGVDMYQKSSTESYSMTAGAVYGNAELKMTGGHVWHNVYGSGAMASVGTVTAKPAGTHVHDEIVDDDDNIVNPDGSEVNYLTGVFKENTGKVTVTITGGTVGDTTPGHEGRNNGRVYGAGRGVSANRSDLVASMEYVNDTYVTIGTSGQKPSEYSGTKPGELNYPYIYGAVFGGGENGHVKTDTHVTMYSGIIGWPLDQGADGQHLTSADGASKNPYRGHIFGGGRGVDPLYHESTETRSSTAGRVYGHTYVTMTGGLVRRAIYGGGLLASVGMYKLAQSDLHIIDMIEDQDKVDGGDTYIEISGGIIGNVMPDGSAITDASTSGFALLAPGDNNGQVFGSSCGMVADNYIQGGVAVDQQYRQMGYSHSTHVNISGGHLFGSVFGSGENGHVWEDTRINVSGGEIGSETSTLIYCGNVYGSGRGVDHPHAHVSETAGKVRGNTTVNVTGGIVWRDVYGGGSLASVGEATEEAKDSKKEVTTDPTTNNPFPYSTGLTRVVIDGTSKVYGSVYGSGRGVASSNTEYRQAAYVKNTLVTVQGTAHVYQNVFGGGNAGHVRKNTDVTISGSAKVDGNVYGGGAGSVKSPTAGLVNHDVTVNIKGGLVGGDVYGGGAIANTNVHDVRNDQTLYPDKASIYGTCSETTRVHCKTDVNLTGGIILGNAYGGGEGVILGAGAPAAEIANAGALVRGDVTVTLNGTAFWDSATWDDEGDDIAATGRVFGCNNLNGTPQGTVLVKVLQTKGVTKSGDTYTVNATKPTKDTKTYELEGVYGGGNLAAYDPWDAEATGQYSTGVVAAKNPLQVVIDGCDQTSIAYVYGGGNAAAAPSTQVVVKGSYELGTVFGGGNGYDNYQLSDGKWYENPGANVGYKNYAHYVKVGETGYDANTHGKGTEADPYKAIENDNASTKEYRIANYSYGSGNANVYLFGGYIHDAFGGSNTKGDIAGKTEVHVNEAKDGEGKPVCPLILDELYGGGNEAYMEGGTDIDMGCITSLKALYGGAKNADVDGDINLTITSGHFDRVFGGNNLGGTISGAITVNIEETGCNPITIGELYGCGNQAAYSVENIDQVTHTSLDFSDPTAANYYKNFPKVNVKSFTSIGRIFGGGLGEGAVVTGNPTVNINEVVGDEADNMNWTYHQTTKTEGEQTVPDAGKTITYSDGTSVTMPTHEKGKIGAIGTVFGGGNAAKVVGNTNVMIGTEKTIKYTSDAADAADRTVVGVDIRDNVFGGGNQAEVTGNTNVEVGPEKE